MNNLSYSDKHIQEKSNYLVVVVVVVVPYLSLVCSFTATVTEHTRLLSRNCLNTTKPAGSALLDLIYIICSVKLVLTVYIKFFEIAEQFSTG